MAARAISSATISFGLVSIPIKVYSTNLSDTSIHFNMLHEKCGTRLKQQYICPKDDVVVPREDRIKGYEFAKGKYVTFTGQEVKSFEAEANRALEITEFIPLKTIDPLYFEKTYYLGPDKGGERAYRLLRAAMNETKRAAVARYATRGKHYTVLVRPLEDGLAMQQLRYADEIRSMEEVPLGEAEIKPSEVQLAVQLIEQIATDSYRPKAYEDDVKRRIQQAIDLKISGEEITVSAPEEPKAQIIDKYFRLPGLIPVTGLESAIAAIEGIVEQGEGARADDENAHYARFVALLNEYDQILKGDPNFEPGRPVLRNPYSMFPNDVHDATGVSLIEDPVTLDVCNLFDGCYEVLIQMMGRLLLGGEESEAQQTEIADITVAFMIDVIGPLGEIITTLPAGPSYPGLNAGPSFRFSRGGHPPPHMEAAWALFIERMKELSAYCGLIQGGDELKAVLTRVRGSLAQYAQQLGRWELKVN